MKILAIDTSCDDTSAAISENNKILSNIFWTKIKLHSAWGGVVPSEAKRQHQEFIEPVINEALKEANLRIEDIDAIAVTYGPGLAIALEAGIDKAKELSRKYNKPIIPINHMIGHIYSNLAMDKNGEPYSEIQDFEFPLLALTISGGHTDLYLMKDHLNFEHIGETLDDAIGESFDKVGRMLGLGFPAGAKIEELAELGDKSAYAFPRPLANTDDFNWSFSGLKTAVLYQVRKMVGDYHSKPGKNTYKLEDASQHLTQTEINDLAASFQEAAIQSILNKVTKAADRLNPKMFVVGGGVIANSTLRKRLEEELAKRKIPIYYPKPMWLCTDNAAMIAVAGYFMHKKTGTESFAKNINSIDRKPNLRI